MKVLLTGATSFTGCHIARALKDAGHQVAATLTRRKADYGQLQTIKRMALADADEWVEVAPFGSERMLDFVRSAKVDVFINHGADIKNYRSPDFDYLASVNGNLHNARALIDALVRFGCSRFVHSGSVFEPDEGEAAARPAPSVEAVSIYGVSKAMVWQPLRFFAVRAGLAVSKVIIANPIGPLENEDRLVPFFAKTWRAGGMPALRSPQLVRDNVPAQWLARVYAQEIATPLAPGAVRVRRPSGYALSNEAFLQLLARNFQSIAGRSFIFEVNPQPSDEPLRRVNSEPLPELKQPAEERKFWESWASSLGDWK